MRQYVLLGCNHASASLEEVANAKLPADNSAEILHRLKERLGADELVYLSTCHRSEWYLAYDGELCPGRLTLALAMALPALTRGVTSLPPVEHCLAKHGGEVARHLFRVAAALDALMVGESQVLGQVKDAFRAAADAGLVGPRLNTLFTQAFRAAKRVRTETALSRRPVSLVSLAERSLRARLATDSHGVAVVGAGEMAAMAAELVRKLDPDRELTIYNRTTERGRALANRLGAAFRPLAELGSNGDRFAAVITATASDVPVMTEREAAHLAPVMLLDLGLPANVSPSCAGVSDVEIIDQGGLRAEAEANRNARGEELGKAEAIIEEQLKDLTYEVMEHDLSPVARSLVATFRELARNELSKMAAECSALPAERVEEAAERLSQRLVRVPMRAIREVAWHHSTDVLTTFLHAVKQ